MQQSQIHSTLDARSLAPFVAGQDYEVEDFHNLAAIGIDGLEKIAEAAYGAEAYGMDTIQQGVTQPSIPTQLQFLQQFLPGFVKVLTAARKIDEIVGISTVGSWEDEQVVQGILEMTGSAVPYGDLSNIPLSSWNENWVTRNIVRFELGMRVGKLEEARAAKIKVNSSDAKRESAALNLEIQRNAVGFYGYNDGSNQTYGFLNDPGLPAYVTVATGTGGYLWSQKTAQEIMSDLRTAIQAIVTASQDTINPETMPFTLAVSTNSVVYLTKITDFGISVRDWLTQTYPKIRITSAPQLNSANGGSNVFYLFADKVEDTSTDDGRTFMQVVAAKFMVLGVQQLPKGYEEDFANATAGVICKRPYAVVRYSGI